MSYQYILFDLDGTLTDPKVGITKSVQHSLSKYDIHVEDLTELEPFIGPPLRDSYKDFYGFSDEKAEEAVMFYREYFSDKGIFENIPYNGIHDLLKTLRENGKTLCVATSKPTVFAKKILDHFEMAEYFTVMQGSNLDGSMSLKADIVASVLSQLELEDAESSSVVMIGDRKHDIIGAKDNKIDSIGVAYGYGSMDELENIEPTLIAKDVEDLTEKLEA